MKRIILYKSIFCAALVMTAVSCSKDDLNVSPTNQLSDATFWKTESDATMALTACYRHWDYWYNIKELDGATDNGYLKKNIYFGPIADGSLTPTSNTGWAYATWITKTSTFPKGEPVMNDYFRYEKIRKYNTFLAHIDDIDMDETLKAQYIAEVKVLRAYNYINKIMFYGDVTLLTKPVTADEANIGRTPKADVVAFVLKDLQDAAADLPEENLLTSKGHFTKGSAYALKARLELYQGMFAEAQADAKKVIDMSCYELYPDYEGLFHESAESTDKESIMKLGYTVDTYYSRVPQFFLPLSEGGWSALAATKDYLDCMQMSNGKFKDDADSGYDSEYPYKNLDPRFYYQIIYPGCTYNGKIYDPFSKTIDGDANMNYYLENDACRSGMNVKKHIEPVQSTDQLNNCGTDIPVLRLAEIYLTYAECALETGNDMAGGLKYLNKVRERAGMPDATELTQRIVRYERRVELAFEGLRYFDIERWDLGEEAFQDCYGSRLGTMDKAGNITWNTTEDYILLEKRTFVSSHNYLFPIPQNELDRNPNIKQNLGY